MRIDYDLSDLMTSQVNLWLFLSVDAICAQILADQAKRLASTQSSQPRCCQEHYWDYLWIQSYSAARRPV